MQKKIMDWLLLEVKLLHPKGDSLCTGYGGNCFPRLGKLEGDSTGNSWARDSQGNSWEKWQVNGRDILVWSHLQ